MLESTRINKAKDYAYRLLNYRPRGEKELADRLKRKKFEPEIIAPVVAFLREVNYLNDAEFARFWVNSRISGKPMGPARIRYELKNKGVAEEIIDAALNSLKEKYDEYEAARGLAISRIKVLGKSIGGDKKRMRQRLYGYLNRRGFSFDVISDVVEGII